MAPNVVLMVGEAVKVLRDPLREKMRGLITTSLATVPEDKQELFVLDFCEGPIKFLLDRGYGNS